LILDHFYLERETRKKMKVTVKEVSGSKFDLDLTPTMSVTEIKQKIEQLKGFSANSQKLVFSGQILADEKTLADYVSWIGSG
jgi:UV excision repair protein RAD23